MNLLFISGWAHDHSSMNVLAEKFSDYKTEIISVHDLIAADQNKLTIDSYATVLKERLALYKEPPIIIGWSMGAMVLLEVLAEKNDFVNKAILISSTLKFCNSDDYKYGIDVRNVKALKMGLRRSLDLTLESFFKDCASPINLSKDILNKKIKFATEQGKVSLSLGLDYLIQKDLRKIQLSESLQILSIHGENDSIIPCAAGEYLIKNFKNAEFISLPNGNHDIINSDVDNVYMNIKKFIDNE